jgi:hypothetical protein
MDARVIGKPGQQLGGIHQMIVTVLPTASVPETISRQLSDRLMVYVPALVCSLICVSVNPITVPAFSVLFPAGGGGVGRGVGRGRGVGVGLAAVVVVVVLVVGVQLTRSVAPTRMQM